MAKANVDIVQGAYRALQARDLETLTALLDPDHVFEQSEDVPWGGRYVGVTGFLEFFGKLHQHIESTVTIDKIVDAGLRVAVVGSTKGVVRSNGAAFEVPFVHVYDLENNRIVHGLAMIDHPRMLSALHGLPPTG